MSRIYVEPPENERKYRKLVALGKELGVPVPQVFLEVEVTKGGNVIHHHKQRSHSWVRNGYNWLFCQLGCVNAIDNAYAAGKLNYKDTGGTVRFGVGTTIGNRYDQTTAGSGFTQAAGVATSGIAVGSDVSAESFEDFALVNPIANGTGAGQLSYVASEPYVITYIAGTKTMTVTMARYMNNNSPGNVTVREVALIGAPFQGAGQYNVVSSRDHIADVVIPASGQLKMTYIMSLVYPA